MATIDWERADSKAVIEMFRELQETAKTFGFDTLVLVHSYDQVSAESEICWSRRGSVYALAGAMRSLLQSDEG